MTPPVVESTYRVSEPKPVKDARLTVEYEDSP